jgi:N-acetylmuramic acid 6-phosphate (MurNAc-6-P) etherase
MTGGDRALISALEGFEDLQLVGKLQLQDRGIQKGDVVFCITEGGETSSVIGAMMAAAEQYEPLTPEEIDAAKTHLYFICNNPEEVLRPFDRSRAVLDHPAITKIFLTTGPQAITGSTRMQATTSETYFMGTVLETGIYLALREKLACRKSERLGFPHSLNPKGRLTSFESLRQALLASWGDLAKFTVLESETYRRKCRATYFAKKALVAVFVDCAERSPTFHLLPLDTVLERDRKCWVQVWTEAKDGTHAWTTFLGRKFRGLDESFYKSHFLEEISDAYLRAAALKSLAKAGNDQEKLYDFSFSRKNILARGPHKGDLGVAVCVDEEIDTLEDPRSSFHRFLKLFKKNGANLALVLVSDYDKAKVKKIIARLPLDPDRDVAMNICLDHGPDPLKMLRQTALKVLLNAHSTAVMARLGKVVGNTMTSVNPSNLKLIGRATYLIMNHVNDVSSGEDWRRRYGTTMPITYAQANAVLFEAREFSAQQSGETSEVELAIIRILEALRRKKNVTWKAALSIAETAGLERYLEEYNPSLRRQL